MYSNIINQFLKSLRALRLYVDRTEPITNFFIDDNVEQDKVEFFLAKILWLKEHGVDLKDLVDDTLNEENLEIKQLAMKYIERIDECLDKCTNNGKLNSHFMMLPKTVKKKYQIMESQEKQNEILFSGSLMLLVTYFENLFSKIFFQNFLKYPNRISLDEKAVTFKLLQDIGNIHEIKEHLIDEEVTKMMYKSFNDWTEFLKKSMKLKLQYILDRIDIIKEIIARRNLYVHNDGIINSIYLSMVCKDTKYKKGDSIGINRDYINNAIDIVECAGVSLVVEMWIKEDYKDEEQIRKITDLIFDEYYCQERWENAKVLYELCLTYKLPSVYELICKMNRWECYKRLGKFQAVVDEVNDIDLSAAMPRFRLAKLALQNKIEEFFILFDHQNDLDEDSLHEWPIFKEIRESEAYIERYNKIENGEQEIIQIEEKNNDIDS